MAKNSNPDVSSDEESSSIDSEERDDKSYGDDVFLDQVEAIEFDWENCEEPGPLEIPFNPEAVKNDAEKYFAETRFKKLRFRLIDPHYNTKEFTETAADTNYIMVKGRVGSNRQINGVYKKEDRFRYVQVHMAHNQISSKEQMVDKVALKAKLVSEGSPEKIWTFGDDDNKDYAIAVCKSEGDTPQTTFKPWHVWSPVENKWVIDYDIQITAMQNEEEPYTSYHKKIKLTPVEINMISQLVIRGKGKDSIARFININPESLEPYYTSAFKTREAIFESGKAEAREKEDLEKRLKDIGLKPNAILQAIDTITNKDRNIQDQSAEYVKFMEEVRRKGKKETKA